MKQVFPSKRRALIALVVLLSITSVGAVIYFWERTRQTTTDITLPATYHYYFRFFPKYASSECRFMVKIEEAPGNDPNVSPMYSFGQYLYEEVPEAALYSFGSTETRGLYYFEFADLCDRGEEIITAGLYYAQKHVDFVFLILPRSEWPEYTFQNKGRFWVDAPDYQPDYWAIRKKAYKACDSSDWERVASYDTQFDPFTAKMYGYFYASYALRLNPKSITAAALKKKFAYRLPAETIASAERILDYAYTRSECFSGER